MRITIQLNAKLTHFDMLTLTIFATSLLTRIFFWKEKMTDLITIDELISQTGTNRIHLAYLTKIGLLPPVVKRKVNGKLAGCYPKDSISKLSSLTAMKNRGITFSQMTKTQRLQEMPESPILPLPISTNEFTIKIKPSNFAYLILGVILGILVTSLNQTGLTSFSQAKNLELSKNESSVYLIKVPKDNLNKLDKTNINYLITN